MLRQHSAIEKILATKLSIEGLQAERDSILIAIQDYQAKGDEGHFLVYKDSLAIVEAELLNRKLRD